MNLEIIVRTYISKIRPHAQSELDWFKQQLTLEAAIEKAALAINSRGKRYHHQRRLKQGALQRAKEALLLNSEAIEESNSFDDLFDLINRLVRPIEGIGELYVYDTALRISAKVGLLPQRVYLHAGTRDGAEKMGLDHEATALEVKTLPPEFDRLEPHEVEDLLCIFKDDLEPTDVESMTERSWCG